MVVNFLWSNNSVVRESVVEMQHNDMRDFIETLNHYGISMMPPRYVFLLYFYMGHNLYGP